jgi:hypothetical protein
VGNVEDNFEEICVVRRDIPELLPTTELIPCKLDLFRGLNRLVMASVRATQDFIVCPVAFGSCLIGNEPIFSISGEVGDGDGEFLLIGDTMNVSGHVSNPGVWGMLAVEGRWFFLLWYEGRGCQDWM